MPPAARQVAPVVPLRPAQAVSCVCDGTGWHEVESEGQGTLEPCPSCRPELFERWLAGRWRPRWRRHVETPAIRLHVERPAFDEVRRMLGGDR